MKLKIKLLVIMIMINILLLKNFIITKLTSENFTARLAQTNLLSINDIAKFLKKTDFDDRLKKNFLNKNESNELSKEVKAIQQKN